MKNKVIDLIITKSVKLTDDSSKSILGEKMSKSGVNEKIKIRQIDKDGNYKRSRNFPYVPKGVNFSSISEAFKEKKDPNVNFSVLEEKVAPKSKRRKKFKFRPTIDYSILDDAVKPSQFYKNLRKKKIKSEGLERLSERVYQLPEKLVEKRFPNLQDFNY